MPCDANPTIESWLERQQEMCEKAKNLLIKIRDYENKRANRMHAKAIYQVGDLVLVHNERLPTRVRTKLSLPWFGPYYVTAVKPNYVKVKASPRLGGILEVSHRHLKHYTELYEGEETDLEKLLSEELAALEDAKVGDDMDIEDEEVEEETTVDMTKEEQQAKGYFTIEAILQHRYKQGWRFLVKWKDYALKESTWEPLNCFVLDGGRVNSTFSDYCHRNGIPQLLAKAQAMSTKLLASQMEKEK
jgi:hypothetical protein